MRTTHFFIVAGIVASSLLATPAVQALTDHPQAFRDAYYLETHEGDLAGAIAGYERVIADGKAPPAVLAEAKQRLAGCREDLRSADLAGLMPAEALAYVELNQPGHHLERVVGLLGLAAGVRDGQGSAADPAYAVPGEPELVVPRRIIISDAIIREIKAFRGVAAAITDINIEQERPEGVLIVHPGNVDLLRGAIETAVQFVRPAEPIRGFRTIEIPDPSCPVTISFTNRLVIAGTQRALVDGVLARLADANQPSLAAAPAFVEQAAQRKDALLFAFVNAPQGLKHMQQMASREPDMLQALAIGQAFFDLAHLNALSLAIGTGGDGLSAEFTMAMAEGQTSIAYNLLRTPPMRGEALKVVPAGAAAVFALGINPADTSDGAAQVNQKAQTVQMVTGLDLGREFFANIREVALYVMPPQAAGAARRGDVPPDIALVTVVGDPAKSEALWDFLLSLPARVQGNVGPASVTQIAGVDVRAYPLHSGVQVYFARSEGRILIGATPEVMAAGLATLSGGANVSGDRALQSATARIGPDTSVAVMGHLGRIAELAAAYAPDQDAQALRLFAQAADESTATITVDEGPTRLHIAAKLANLPRVERILEVLAGAGLLAPAHLQVTQAEPAGIGQSD